MRPGYNSSHASKVRQSRSDIKHYSWREANRLKKLMNRSEQGSYHQLNKAIDEFNSA